MLFTARAMNYVDAWFLGREAFFNIAAAFPDTLRRIRRRALLLALRRDIVLRASLMKSFPGTRSDVRALEAHRRDIISMPIPLVPDTGLISKMGEGKLAPAQVEHFYLSSMEGQAGMGSRSALGGVQPETTTSSEGVEQIGRTQSQHTELLSQLSRQVCRSSSTINGVVPSAFHLPCATSPSVHHLSPHLFTSHLPGTSRSPITSHLSPSPPKLPSLLASPPITGVTAARQAALAARKGAAHRGSLAGTGGSSAS